MIMARNEDGTYSQVGFVKDNAGIDTEYIYDKDGDIVFEKGFTRETSGTVPLTINGIEKDLKAWSITGNTVQNGTPTPENPVEVQAVGERTANLFDYKKYFESTFTEYNEFFEVAEIQLKPFTTYTFATSFVQTQSSGVVNTAFIIATSTEKPLTVNGGISSTSIRTKTTEADGIIKIYKRIKGGYIPKKEDFDSGMHWLMVNEGSTPLPYEPYGYKIPVVTRGKNLLKLKEVNLTIKGVEVSVKNNSITVKGVAKEDGGRTVYLSESFVLQPGTYFISGDIVNSMVYCLTNKSNGNAVVVSHSTSKFTLTEKTEVAFGLNFISGASYDATVNVMLNEGDKILPYEPYHEPITTPIYLPTPLYSGEVMRSDGTITRSDGTTETFTAPQIPTINGTTVIDVDTAVKPTEMYTKYKSSK